MYHEEPDLDRRWWEHIVYVHFDKTCSLQLRFTLVHLSLRDGEGRSESRRKPHHSWLVGRQRLLSFLWKQRLLDWPPWHSCHTLPATIQQVSTACHTSNISKTDRSSMHSREFKSLQLQTSQITNFHAREREQTRSSLHATDCHRYARHAVMDVSNTTLTYLVTVPTKQQNTIVELDANRKLWCTSKHEKGQNGNPYLPAAHYDVSSWKRIEQVEYTLAACLGTLKGAFLASTTRLLRLACLGAMDPARNGLAGRTAVPEICCICEEIMMIACFVNAIGVLRGLCLWAAVLW